MAKIKLFRVADPGACAVQDPDTGVYITPDPRKPYREDHPLVVNYPWLFLADEDSVERATNDPGDKRRLPRQPGVYEGNI